MPRVIGIISGKGGVGKTVIAINLAAALSKWYSKRVLLVDCNITTSHVGLYLGLYSTPITLNDALRGAVAVEKTIYNHACGIDVIPASLKLEDLKDTDWNLVGSKLSPLFNNYDFILLDSSPGFNRESIITMQTCNEVLMVTTPIVHIVADVIKCRQLSEEFGVKPLGIVLNMVRKKPYELSTDEVTDMTGLHVIASVPYDDKVMESIVSKTPVINLRSKAGSSFMELASHLTGGEAHKKDILSVIRTFLRLP